MCSYTACPVRRCCGGETREAQRGECKDSHDFSSAGCGLDVQSCTGRCYDEIWRIRLDQSCEASRPSACCEA
jgi:hypothetical protein